MADPFESLRAPATPVDPEPCIRRPSAGAPRARPHPSEGSRRVRDRSRVPARHHRTPPGPARRSPTSRCTTPRRAIDWYVDVFGARLLGDPIVMPDGRVGHAELELAGGVDVPRPGVPRDRPRRHRDVEQRRVSLVLHSGGRRHDGLPSPSPRARSWGPAAIAEDYGHRRRDHRRPVRPPVDAADAAAGVRAAAPVRAIRPGDLAYSSLWVPDAQRAPPRSSPRCSGGASRRRPRPATPAR